MNARANELYFTNNIPDVIKVSNKKSPFLDQPVIEVGVKEVGDGVKLNVAVNETELFGVYLNKDMAYHLGKQLIKESETDK